MTTASFDWRSSDTVFVGKPCAFCQIIRGEIPGTIFYRDAAVVALLTHAPTAEGHALIIPAQHYPFLSELPEETGRQLWTTAQRTGAALRSSGLKCEGISLRLSDGVGARQNVPHVHMHVVPRFQGDGFRPIDSKVIVPHAELELVAAKIRVSYQKRWG